MSHYRFSRRTPCRTSIFLCLVKIIFASTGLEESSNLAAADDDVVVFWRSETRMDDADGWTVVSDLDYHDSADYGSDTNTTTAVPGAANISVVPPIPSPSFLANTGRAAHIVSAPRQHHVAKRAQSTAARWYRVDWKVESIVEGSLDMQPELILLQVYFLAADGFDSKESQELKKTIDLQGNMDVVKTIKRDPDILAAIPDVQSATLYPAREPFNLKAGPSGRPTRRSALEWNMLPIVTVSPDAATVADFGSFFLRIPPEMESPRKRPSFPSA